MGRPRKNPLPQTIEETKSLDEKIVEVRAEIQRLGAELEFKQVELDELLIAKEKEELKGLTDLMKEKNISLSDLIELIENKTENNSVTDKVLNAPTESEE